MDRYKKQYMWITTAVVICGFLMIILNFCFISIALPYMLEFFKSTFETGQLVLTGYILASVFTIPITAKLIRAYGSKRLYILGLSVFVIGSILAIYSWSMGAAIWASIIQGFGSGIIISSGISLIVITLPSGKTNAALMQIGAAAIFAPAAGYLIGGYIIQFVGWKAVFAINISVGMLTAAVAFIYLMDSNVRDKVSFDYIGTIILGGFLVTVFSALNQAFSMQWTSPYIISLLLVSIICVIVFIDLEIRNVRPLLNLEIFYNRKFRFNIVISSVIVFVNLGVLPLLVLCMGPLWGYSNFKAGTIMFLCTASMGSGGFFYIWIKNKFKYKLKWISSLGVTLLTVVTILLTRLTMSVGSVKLTAILMVWGLGFGFALVPYGVNILKRLQWRLAVVSAIMILLSGSLGITLSSLIFKYRIVFHGIRLNENINIYSSQFAKAQLAMRQILMQQGVHPSASKTELLGGLHGMLFRQATLASFKDILWISTFLMIGGLIFNLFIKNIRREEEIGERNEIEFKRLSVVTDTDSETVDRTMDKNNIEPIIEAEMEEIKAV